MRDFTDAHEDMGIMGNYLELHPTTNETHAFMIHFLKSKPRLFSLHWWDKGILFLLCSKILKAIFCNNWVQSSTFIHALKIIRWTFLGLQLLNINLLKRTKAKIPMRYSCMTQYEVGESTHSTSIQGNYDHETNTSVNNLAQ